MNLPGRCCRCSLDRPDLREKTRLFARTEAGNAEEVRDGAQRLHSVGFAGR